MKFPCFDLGLFRRWSSSTFYLYLRMTQAVIRRARLLMPVFLQRWGRGCIVKSWIPNLSFLTLKEQGTSSFLCNNLAWNELSSRLQQCLFFRRGRSLLVCLQRAIFSSDCHYIWFLILRLTLQWTVSPPSRFLPVNVNVGQLMILHSVLAGLLFMPLERHCGVLEAERKLLWLCLIFLPCILIGISKRKSRMRFVRHVRCTCIWPLCKAFELIERLIQGVQVVFLLAVLHQLWSFVQFLNQTIAAWCQITLLLKMNPMTHGPSAFYRSQVFFA